MRSLHAFFLSFSLACAFGQIPVSQVEGFLEVYVPTDTTSLYLGKNSGENTGVSSVRKNTFVGANTGQSSVSSEANSFYGYNAGSTTAFGYNNSFFGANAGELNKDGSSNSFFGSQSGSSNIGGVHNSFFGFQSGTSNSGGNLNSFFGYEAGKNNSIGHSNVFYGFMAGHSNISGNNNTYFGSNSGRNLNGNENIAIGNNAGLSSALASGQSAISNRLFIDVESSPTPLIYGEFDNDLVSINHKSAISGQGHLSGLRIHNIGGGNYWTLYTFTGSGTLGLYRTDDGNEKFQFRTNGDFVTDGAVNPSSDRNRKEQIICIDELEILQKVSHLPITEWQYIGSSDRHIGPMAQDFHEAFGLGMGETTIATVDADGVALAAIKALIKENDQLKRKYDSLQNRLDQLETRLKSMKSN